MADRQATETAGSLAALIGDAVKALTLEVTANLKAGCPVDTGHARANIIPSIGQPFELEAEGTAAQERGEALVLSYTLDQGDVIVTNNVPYWGPLIGGHSDQAPPGWDVAAIDQAVATVQQEYDVQIDVGRSQAVSARGAGAAAGLASAYSPFGGDDD